MDNKKMLIGVIVVLAAALIFETAYLLGRGSRPDAIKNNTMRVRHSAQQPINPSANRFNALDYRTGWDPFAEMAQMQQAMHHMFEDSFANGLVDQTISRTSAAFEPNISINQKDDAYVVKADLPGMDKSTINVEVNGRVLTISGERKEEETKQDKGFYRQELSYGSFSRSVMLPEDAKPDKIASEYKNGVLTITIPKEQVAKPAASKIKVPVQ